MSHCAKALRGLWVITATEGIKIGGVHEVYFDLEQKKLSGFDIKARAFFNDQGLWLPLGNVKKIGEDVVFIAKADAIVQEEPQGSSLNDLIGMAVDSKDGKKLGKLTDIIISKTTLTIDTLCLDGKQCVDVNLDELVLGKDVILVQANAVCKEYQQKEKDETSLVSDIRDVISKYSSSAIKQGEEIVHQAADVIKRKVHKETTDEKTESEKDSVSVEKLN